MAGDPDPRINPYRNDLAAAHLKGSIKAASYAEGVAMQVVQGVLPLRKSPGMEAEQISQLRYGDRFTVYETRDGWCWGQCARDSYVGYAAQSGLSANLFTPTHTIENLTSFVFARPSIKAPVLDRLTILSGVAVVDEVMDKGQGLGAQRFFRLSTGGYVHREHFVPLAGWLAPDYVTIAGHMLHVPYLWGGITPLGFDCSGMVQMTLEAAGKACPRDSDMQAAALGTHVADTIRDVDLKRGDFIFMKGHVGMMVDGAEILHANAYHGKVMQEPLQALAGRYDGTYSVRRF